MTDSYLFKVASEPWEFEQINRLNYETFVEEIPQHHPNEQRILVDRFHSENTYLICVCRNEVAGMLAVREQRPFSLDKKLADMDSYLPPYRSICEVRLLALRKSSRHSRVAYGLLKETVKYCLDNGHDIAVISGILKQQKLYKHLGFVPFGHVVGDENAQFQPMYLTPGQYAHSKKPALAILPAAAEQVILTPGPVEVSAGVRRAFAETTLSHRSPKFMALYTETKKQLCDLVNAEQVEIMMGSGTLANDAIAAQLSSVGSKGLILSNGEFGDRLIDSALRLSLNFETVKLDWGEPFKQDSIEQLLRQDKGIKWLWAVHCETSTGMLNDLKMFKTICAQNGMHLCLDCISSIGTMPVDLSQVYLASTVSGKGLGSFAGIAIVFYNHRLISSGTKLPRYLDLGYYAQHQGVPFTILSNLIAALNASLQELDVNGKFARNSTVSEWLRKELRELGLRILVDQEHASPSVITICLPPYQQSLDIGKQLDDKGFYTHYRSDYLRANNWLQICVMNELPPDVWSRLALQLRHIVR